MIEESTVMNTIGVELALARMDSLVLENPLQREFETDARYIWPERWAALRRFFEAVLCDDESHPSANGGD